ncbi:hypothetical protein [Streptomyces microflavus]|uniref:restriction endonuclease subunit S n=1 Tax=Streptomyces microflavus TaxID=1919 RepID=UPI0033B83FEE
MFTLMSRSPRIDDEVVTCFRDGMVTLRRNRRTKGFTESVKEIGYQGIRKGDLVIHAMDAFAGAVGVSDSDGKSTPVYAACQPHAGVVAEYYALLVRHMALSGWITALAKGIRERSTDFRFSQFSSQDLPVPPTEEQQAIVKYTQHVDREVGETIRSKKQLVALLVAQKNTVAHQVVTCGMNPSVVTKESGYPWVATIPSHWEMVPIKRLLKESEYGTSKSPEGHGPIRILTMGNIRSGRVRVPKVGNSTGVPSGLTLQHGDLLFNRTNSPDLVGKVGIYDGPDDETISFASYLVRLRTRKDHCTKWLNYVLNSPAFWAYARGHALLSLHQANLNPTRYGQLAIPLPPKSEQEEIAKYLHESELKIDSAIERAEREIALLREYQTRLTADVVTGKLDVRAAAAALPNVDLRDPDLAEPYDVDEDGLHTGLDGNDVVKESM